MLDRFMEDGRTTGRRMLPVMVPGFTFVLQKPERGHDIFMSLTVVGPLQKALFSTKKRTRTIGAPAGWHRGPPDDWQQRHQAQSILSGNCSYFMPSLVMIWMSTKSPV